MCLAVNLDQDVLESLKPVLRSLVEKLADLIRSTLDLIFCSEFDLKLHSVIVNYLIKI